MQHAQETSFYQTRLTGWARTLRVVFSVCFSAFWVVLLVHPEATVRDSSVGLVLLVLLLLVGIYDLLRVFRQRLFWNDIEVFDRGVFWHSKRQSWTNLGKVSNSMQRRATLLGFGRITRLKVYWGYDAHREIVDLAERKLRENARTS